MKRKIIVIKGDNFFNTATFYNEIDRVLTKDLTWDTANNLNACNDLLYGGFGVYDYEEEIELRWESITQSSQLPGKEFTDVLIEIIRSHPPLPFYADE